ncbi:helix-turn-helix domain-containing protein [Streptococcus anginosus]|uniref:helix-turn-helix domain-containing protein n=1 Tax=Streptococcus anginosus TaxID=1328 RepID=UPI0021F90B0A|nr:helix-turn-helix transcriptional regulator [Streptococcus anginosus]MCW0988181.1 helix-turn-helix domain-containing protein [Streptococcus anginosus]MCW1009821.1 helix-turn-helix domain-containing protein [Streptococcus anginosus]MCW1061800.1 helix-turn-helix domain-containing protein [Streptococcus anginosus]
MFVRIRNLREDADLTQENIALLLNCSRSTYSRYEEGNRTIDICDLIKLADYYDVSLDYLVGRVDFKYGHRLQFRNKNL